MHLFVQTQGQGKMAHSKWIRVAAAVAGCGNSAQQRGRRRRLQIQRGRPTTRQRGMDG